MEMHSHGETCLKLMAAVCVLVLLAVPGFGQDPCMVEHPLTPARPEFSGQCPNCGMMRSMWARTWMEFDNSAGKHGVCSIHCLVDMAIKAGERPRSVQTAMYLAPEKMVSADAAWFVVGSKARGTMTMNSKIAFPSKDEAEVFAKSCGGKALGFHDTFALARADLPKENAMITERRVKDGKIAEPIDNKDECAVCRMYPARYAKHKCQLTDKDKKIYHFCSTQCLFRFLGNSREFAKGDVSPAMIWVTDYPSGSWIGAKNAYYLVGSKIQGPMGHEALAFDKNSEALSLSRQEGGDVLMFSQVGIKRIEAKE